jgi:hypothetical protein
MLPYKRVELNIKPSAEKTLLHHVLLSRGQQWRAHRGLPSMSGLNGYGGHGSDPRAGVDTGIFPVQALDETGAQTTTASHSSADARLTTGGGSSQGGWKGPGLGHREEVAVVPPASGAVFSPVLAIVDMTDGGLKSSVKEQKETVTSTEEPAKPNSPVKHRIINTTSAQVIAARTA